MMHIQVSGEYQGCFAEAVQMKNNRENSQKVSKLSLESVQIQSENHDATAGYSISLFSSAFRKKLLST